MAFSISPSQLSLHPTPQVRFLSSSHALNSSFVMRFPQKGSVLYLSTVPQASAIFEISAPTKLLVSWLVP